jgi:3'-phosphoadenosine 5'-phosphosulfate sulfotransferase (PAPS reductase)/FAD synthetase
MSKIVGLSGGKDSTAMALRLAEVEPDDYVYLCTPTGNELPDMVAHWKHLETLLGKPLTYLKNGTLESWIDHWDALPNWRQRWCTRVLKIEPALAFVKPEDTLFVGLRADEEERKGIYSDSIKCRFPLREWGWGLAQVRAYLFDRGVAIPRRTDCAWCPFQRLGEWYALWVRHPDYYDQAVQKEKQTGFTFRTPGKDSFPASLELLAVEFAKGRKPRGAWKETQLDLIESCRVCRL